MSTGSECRRAGLRVAHEAIGSDGQVIPQQWLVRTTALGVPADDRRRLDLVVYTQTAGKRAVLGRDPVSPLARTGHPQPGAADTNGAVLRVAERRKRSTYTELCGGPQELGGRRALEWRGSPLRAAPTPRPVAKSSAGSPPRGRRGLVAPLVRHTGCCRAAGRRQHGTGAGLASAAPPVSE